MDTISLARALIKIKTNSNSKLGKLLRQARSREEKLEIVVIYVKTHPGFAKILKNSGLHVYQIVDKVK